MVFPRQQGCQTPKRQQAAAVQGLRLLPIMPAELAATTIGGAKDAAMDTFATALIRSRSFLEDGRVVDGVVLDLAARREGERA